MTTSEPAAVRCPTSYSSRFPGETRREPTVGLLDNRTEAPGVMPHARVIIAPRKG